MRLASAIVAILLLAACGAQRWEPAAGGAPAAAPKPGERRIVIFAPTAAAPLAEAYPEARQRYPHDLADRVALLAREVDARVGDALPASDDAAWSSRVAATAGAHLVVLSEVLEVTRSGGVAGRGGATPRVRAVARLRALDPLGREVWAKTASGEVDEATSPKLLTAASRAESRAAWEALSSACGALIAWLRNAPDVVSAAPADASALVEVAIDSRPPNADILVDGELRGTTPRTLKLPRRAVTLRLERQGHRPWERTLTPSDGLSLTPALEPVAPSDASPH